jgi:hypothetical protein
LRHDIHEISNELYTRNKQSKIDKENKERKKRYNQDLRYTLLEEIENFINDLDNEYNVNDIQLIILDNQDIIIDNTTCKIVNKGEYDYGNKSNVRLDLKEIFLTQFNLFFREYKTRHNLEKAIKKEKSEEVKELILDRLLYTFDTVNELQQYDMKEVINNMYCEDYIKDLFDYLKLDYTKDNKDNYYKSLNELKRRRKQTIKKIKKEKANIPFSWKCYGILKAIDKIIK